MGGMGRAVWIADDSGRRSSIGREEATRQLIRIGYDDLRGYLDGGIAAWQAAGFPTARTRLLTPA